MERRPRLLLAGRLLPLLRMVDAAIGLYAIPSPGSPSTGRWNSPARHEAPAAAQQGHLEEEAAAAAITGMATGFAPDWDPASIEAGQTHASG